LTGQKLHDAVYDSAFTILKNSGAPSSAYAQTFMGMPKKGASDDEYKKWIDHSLLESDNITNQLNRVAPNPVQVNNGASTQFVAGGNPEFTGVKPGIPQGVPVKNELPPTAVVMGNDGQPRFLGAEPGAPGPKSGPAIGQVEGTVGPVQVANKHFEGIVSDANAAPTRIAALQTIMQEAPKAVTGGGAVGDFKRNIMKAWANIYGADTSDQTATDVMAKNLALIAGQAGNTDAARSLAEMGNPNFHMTKDAIEQTGAQLLGIEKKKIAAQQVFSGINTNDPRYGQLMTQWQRVADPRLFEYAALPESQKKAWKDRLDPKVRNDLAMKAAVLEKMGVEP